MMADAGLTEAVQGTWSDAMVDSIVLHGDEAAVAANIRAFFDAGASEILAAPVIAGDDRRKALDRAAEFLAALR